MLVPPGLLVAGSVLVMKSATLALLAAALWFVLSAVVCGMVLRSATPLFERRRENLLLVATGR